jgi:ABC-type multidrug transport system fused ATPase/permease subunit
MSTPSLVAIVTPAYSLLMEAGMDRIDILNNDYHRIRRIRQLAFDARLRPEISANGVGTWFVSELKKSYYALGDLSIKPYWENLTYMSPPGYIMVNSLVAVASTGDYLWYLYEGIRTGVSLGTLQLVSGSVDNAVYQLNMVAWQIEAMSRQWTNVIAFFRCVDMGTEMKKPHEMTRYIRKDGGMKIEARDVHFKYDAESGNEILKGVSFVIEPGKLVAIVGYSLI